MSDPIKLIITAAGLEAALNVELTGIVIKLDKVKFSTDLFESVVNDPHTDLANVVAESSIVAGGTSASQNTLRFTTMVNTNAEHTIGSLGLYTDDDVLFAIASVDTGYLMKLYPRVSFVMAFGMSLSTYLLENITVVIDGEASIAAAMIFQHEDHGDPHPQYLLKNEVDGNNNSLSEKFFPYYSCIITSDINYNPAIALEPLLGANTKWRKLPFLLNGVSNAGDVGKLTYLKSGADVAAMNVIIWQRMPNDYVTPVAKIYYEAMSSFNSMNATSFFAFDYVNSGSFYIIKMNVAVDLPIQYKMTSSGKAVDNFIKESSGFLFVDDDGFGVIPTRVKMNANLPQTFDHKIELSLSERYQHVCTFGDQKYRFLDTERNFYTNVQYSISFSKKYVSANEQFEIIVTRLATNVEDQFLILSHFYLSDVEDIGISSNGLRAVDYFDLMPESSAGVTLHESFYGANTITDNIFKLSFVENEVDKKIVLRVKNSQILNRMNILAQLNDNNNLSGLSLDYSNNFLLAKNIPQPSYLLSYNILGLTLTISLETTLVPENTHVAWNITNYEGDPISPNDMSGEFVIDADGHAEVEFTIPNGGDAFSFALNLTGRDEYVGVEKS